MTQHTDCLARPLPARASEYDEAADSIGEEASRSACLAVAGLLFGFVVAALLDVVTGAPGISAMVGL